MNANDERLAKAAHDAYLRVDPLPEFSRSTRCEDWKRAARAVLQAWREDVLEPAMRDWGWFENSKDMIRSLCYPEPEPVDPRLHAIQKLADSRITAGGKCLQCEAHNSEFGVNPTGRSGPTRNLLEFPHKPDCPVGVTVGLALAGLKAETAQ